MPEDMEKTKRDIMHVTEAEQTLAKIEKVISRGEKRKSKSGKAKVKKPKKRVSKLWIAPWNWVLIFLILLMCMAGQ